MDYALIVVWDTGETDSYTNYDSYDEAKDAGQGMKMIFGNQISWWGVVEL